MIPSVLFLGHWVDSAGLLHPSLTSLKHYWRTQHLWIFESTSSTWDYYLNTVNSFQISLQPWHLLYWLLKKVVFCKWSIEEEESFQYSKVLLTSSPLLVHFDPDLPLELACDASAMDIGAVLGHILTDRSEHLIGYALRSLSEAEKNYSQLEKEGWSCVFDVRRFHSYVLGHHFPLFTDRKPLLALLNEHRSTSPVHICSSSHPSTSTSITSPVHIHHESTFAPVHIHPHSHPSPVHIARHQSTFASGHSFYQLMSIHSSSEILSLSHSNADALSRLPLQVPPAASNCNPNQRRFCFGAHVRVTSYSTVYPS